MKRQCQHGMFTTQCKERAVKFFLIRSSDLQDVDYLRAWCLKHVLSDGFPGIVEISPEEYVCASIIGE